MSRLVVAAGAMLALGVAGAAPALAQGAIAREVAAQPGELREWMVPWERSGPRDPYVAPDGRVWFVGQRGNYIAVLDPRSGQFRRYEIADGTHPHNLVVDGKGTVWFTGNRNGRLVQLDPATGKLTDHLMPDSTVRDPHTMTFDAQGNAWFTAQQSDAVGRLDAKTGQVRFWKTGEGTRPYGIVTDPRGRVWVDLFGTNKLAMIDPATMQLREFALPHERARPRRIAVTSDGTVWYGDYTRGYLGRLEPATGKVSEFALPSGTASLPYAMTVDDADRIWVAETGVKPNRLVAFDTKAQRFTETVLLEGGEERNTVRHMVFDPRSRAIWFGTDRNTIGRATVPSARPSAVTP